MLTLHTWQAYSNINNPPNTRGTVPTYIHRFHHCRQCWVWVHPGIKAQYLPPPHPLHSISPLRSSGFSFSYHTAGENCIFCKPDTFQDWNYTCGDIVKVSSRCAAQLGIVGIQTSPTCLRYDHETPRIWFDFSHGISWVWIFLSFQQTNINGDYADDWTEIYSGVSTVTDLAANICVDSI